MKPKQKITPEISQKMERGEYIRASGEAECKVCKKTLYDHPQIEGLPIFVVDCKGDIFKL